MSDVRRDAVQRLEEWTRLVQSEAWKWLSNILDAKAREMLEAAAKTDNPTVMAKNLGGHAVMNELITRPYKEIQVARNLLEDLKQS